MNNANSVYLFAMIKSNYLAGLLLMGILTVCSPLESFCQEDDDKEEREDLETKADSSYRWCFYKIAQVTKTGQSAIVALEFKSTNNLFNKPEALSTKYASGLKDTLRYPLSSQATDTLEIFPAHDPQVKKPTKIRVPLRKAEVWEKLSATTLRYEIDPKWLPAYIKSGDHIALKKYEPAEPGLMLYLMEDYDITLRNSSNKPFEFGYELNNAAVEMLYIKLLQLDLVDYSNWLKTKNLNPKLEGGPVNGMPLIEVLESATEDKIYRYLNFMLSYPGKYRGSSYKFLETYTTWLINNQPAGNLKNRTIETEWKRLVPLAPIAVDLKNITLNGLVIPNNKTAWLKAFPFFSSEEQDEDDTALKSTYYDYSAANHIAYFPQKRMVRLYVSHRFITTENLFQKSKKEIEQLMGKPVKMVTDKEYGLVSYIYKKPNGTLKLQFGFPGVEGNGVDIIDIYTDKFEAIKSFN